ncbi:MAG TPA: hypothetical protein VFA78_04265, partial [Chloroflexota bacterium]|nr:hypothetical protein [Chloroflexota bacterium]
AAKLIEPYRGSVVVQTREDAPNPFWVELNGYEVVTRDIPPEFAPFNAVVRVRPPSEEGEVLDFLAELHEAWT